MIKISRNYSFVLITAGILICQAPIFAAISDGFKAQFLKNNTDILISKKESNNQSFWNTIRALFIETRNKTINHGAGEFCSIAPNVDAPKTWSKKPIFAWQGVVKKIEVKSSQNADMWSYDFKPEDAAKQSMIYGYGDENSLELQDDQIYYYSIEYQTETGTTDTETGSIFVLDTEQREIIQKELDEIVKNNPNMSAEERAMKFALYFEQKEFSSGLSLEEKKKGLFLDVVREIFALESSSPEWLQKRQELSNVFCQKVDK